MLELTKTNLYKKELKLMLKRGRNGQKMFDIVAMILNNANQGMEHHLLLPEKYCPSTRKNFLSYSYVLYKFCQLLDKDEYLKYFTLLKSREKLHLQDQIWKKICEEVNWEFIQSI